MHLSFNHNIKKNLFAFFSVTLLLIFTFFSISFSENTENSQNVYVIPVEGEVGPGMATFIKRSVRDIPLIPQPLIIFEMDTFGGRVDSALQIVEIISNISGAKTLAFVKTKAISAGALIALSCDEIAMKNNTTIGDCAPISYSKEGPKMLGEKFQSPLRAKFRALAKKNNYNENLAEAMVSADLEIYKINMNDKTVYIDDTEYADLTPKEKKKITSKKTVVKKGELLTMNDIEAHEFGFSKISTVSIHEYLEKSGLTNYHLTDIKKSWSESFVGFIISITPILMMIGLAAVYTEIKAPGFGAPGIIGIICLSMAFGSQYIVGLADYTELMIILLGIVLLGLEVFVIPGFGIAGVAGFLFVTAGMILSLQGFVIPKPSFPWQFDLMRNNITIVLGSYLVSFIGAMLMLRYVLPKVSIGSQGPYLSKTLKESHADSHETLKAKIGDEGIAITYLRPSGKMKTGIDIFDVISESEFIESGTPVVITQIRGNQLIVSRKEQK